MFVCAGEASGDLHAAAALRALQGLTPVEAFGVGGARLEAAGMEVVVSASRIAAVGLSEVWRTVPQLVAAWRRIKRLLRERRPQLALLVDFPDFNLRVAAQARRLGIPVLYYIGPQVWAWRRGRVRVVRRRAREVLCILPFEVDFYAAHGVRARYVGHPLVDEIARVGLLDQSVPVVAGRLSMLPGSRAMEVSQLLPVMMKTLEKLPPDVVEDVVLVEAPGMEEEIDLREYVEVIVRRWKWIAGITLVAVVTAAIVSFFLMAPIYEAKAGVVIVKSKSEITFEPKYRTLTEEELARAGDVASRRKALEALVKSSSVAAEVIAKLGSMLEPEERDASALLDMVETEMDGDLIGIKVRGKDPKKITAIANAWGEAYESYVNELYGGRAQSPTNIQAQVAEARESYQQAEEALARFMGDNRIDELEREIQAKRADYCQRLEVCGDK